jgi:hypothetical protein
MAKLLLVSILGATVAIPIWAAREEKAHKAFKKMVFFLFAYNVFYVLALRYLYFQLL